MEKGANRDQTCQPLCGGSSPFNIERMSLMRLAVMEMNRMTNIAKKMRERMTPIPTAMISIEQM